MINRFNFGLQPGLWEPPCLELIQQFDPAAELVFNGECSRDIDITYAGDILTFEGWDKAGRKHQKEYNLSGKPLEKDTFKWFLYLFLVAFFG
ncbi:MAG: coproporphyrinogen dehydrogenase HemZ, partial [Eubacterium aggregans]